MIKNNILLVGCGKMGGAMLSGFLPKLESADQVIVSEHSEQVRYDIEEKLGVIAVGNLADCEFDDDIKIAAVILALKPQIIEQALPDILAKCNKDTVFISVIAGKTISFFQKYLGVDAKIIRTMPNLPALIGQGVTVACSNDNISNEDEALATSLLQSVGECHFIDDESKLDAVTAISGSGPAYVFHFVESMIKAGVELGLSEGLATALATKTLSGCAALIEQSEKNVTALKEQVISPNGTTFAGLNVLSADDALEKLIKNTTKAACDRSKELAE